MYAVRCTVWIYNGFGVLQRSKSNMVVISYWRTAAHAATWMLCKYFHVHFVRDRNFVVQRCSQYFRNNITVILHKGENCCTAAALHLLHGSPIQIYWKVTFGFPEISLFFFLANINYFSYIVCERIQLRSLKINLIYQFAS